MTSTSIIIVPGWRDSGPGHWQTLWAERLPQARRVVQDDWHTPTRSAWVARLEETVLEQPGAVVIVAHSLGCITTAHMKPEAAARVRARVEHVFAVVKRLWGFTKVRYRGLQKNATRAFTALALANIYLARGRLLGQVRP